MYTYSERMSEMFNKEKGRKEGRKGRSKINILEFGRTCVVVLS